MSFLKYRYFLVLCEELSFQKAAHRLLISQQGLSSQIHKLEEEYGLKFFERKPRVKLTLAGEHMMLHCKHILLGNFILKEVVTLMATKFICFIICLTLGNIA